MNIGIDIDGVLTNLEKYQLTHGKKFFGREAANESGYEINDKFNVPKSWEEVFWTRHVLDYTKNSKARTNSDKVTNALHKNGHKVYIVTARKYHEYYGDIMKKSDMPKIVDKWLKDNNIYYDKIYYVGEDKRDTVKKLKLDYMVEDKPDNISNIAKTHKVIIFDSKYNENMTGENMIHAKNWKEVYKIITKKDID